jgi:hypothetical protein
VLPFGGKHSIFRLVALLPAVGASLEERKQVASDFLNACGQCQNRGTRTFRRVLRPFFQEVASTGVVDERLAYFLVQFFRLYGWDTQKEEGLNSQIKRMSWLARRIKVVLMSKRLCLKNTKPMIEFADFNALRPRVAHALRPSASGGPLGVERFEPLKKEERHVFPERWPHVCTEHANTDARQAASTIAKAIELHFEALHVVRIGTDWYVGRNKHQRKSTVRPLKCECDLHLDFSEPLSGKVTLSVVLPDPAAAAAGSEFVAKPRRRRVPKKGTFPAPPRAVEDESLRRRIWWWKELEGPGAFRMLEDAVLPWAPKTLDVGGEEELEDKEDFQAFHFRFR